MEVVWSPAADRDLAAIDRYLAEADPRAAQALVGRILDVGERLGLVATGRPGRYPGTYEKPVPRSSYILLYQRRKRSDRDVIYIVRVIHTARNWRPGELPPD